MTMYRVMLLCVYMIMGAWSMASFGRGFLIHLLQLLEGVEEMNSVVVEDSNFTSCSAVDGGGSLSLIMEQGFLPSSLGSPTILRINRTTFNESYSQTGGSALGLVSNARIDHFSFVAIVEDR